MFYFLFYFHSEKSKRRTKTIASTIEPTWNQTFIYCPVKETDLQERLLEITGWDYDRIGASEFLGEVCVTFSELNSAFVFLILYPRKDICDMYPTSVPWERFM